VALDSSGDVWVGGWDATPFGPSLVGGPGARWFDGEAWQGADSPVVASGSVTDIEVDTAGNIWVGMVDDLWRYTPGDGWIRFTPPPDAPGGFLVITDIGLSPSGTPWITTLQCGGAGCGG